MDCTAPLTSRHLGRGSAGLLPGRVLEVLQNQLQGWSQLDNVLFRQRDIHLSGVPSQEDLYRVQGG